MNEEKNTPVVTTKHHGSARRPNRLELSFSDSEWQTLESLAASAGEDKLSVFCRKLILGGGVIAAAVSAEDRRDIAQLSKVGSNLWELRKDLRNFGFDETNLQKFRTIYAEMLKIIEYFRAKIKTK